MIKEVKKKTFEEKVMDLGLLSSGEEQDKYST